MGDPYLEAALREFGAAVHNLSVEEWDKFLADELGDGLRGDLIKIIAAWIGDRTLYRRVGEPIVQSSWACNNCGGTHDDEGCGNPDFDGTAYYETVEVSTDLPVIPCADCVDHPSGVCDADREVSTDDNEGNNR